MQSMQLEAGAEGLHKPRCLYEGKIESSDETYLGADAAMGRRRDWHQLGRDGRVRTYLRVDLFECSTSFNVVIASAATLSTDMLIRFDPRRPCRLYSLRLLYLQTHIRA